MRFGITVSTLAHALLLAWALLSFTAKPLDAVPTESMPVDIVSATDFSQMTAGTKKAPKPETPKPLAEKVGESKPVKEPIPKVSEKQEVQSASAEPTPPKEAPPKPEAKPEKPDQIAEALKKEPPKPQPPKKPQPKLDLSKVENKLALLDKREQQRHAATDAIINPTPTLGTSTGRAPTLSQSEMDWLRGRLTEHLKGCWDVPAGLADARELFVMIRFQLRRDGTLGAEPTVTNNVPHPAFQVAAESALRAVRKCTPYTFLPVAKYDVWKDLEIKFDPREMFGG
jgi:colicin import membrane protein